MKQPKTTSTRKYKSLYQMLDQCNFMLNNEIERTVCPHENHDLYDAMSEWSMEQQEGELMKYAYNSYNLDDELQKELERLANKNPELSVSDCMPQMSEDLLEQLEDAMRDADYPDIYQTFIVDDETMRILKDYGEFVYTIEDCDLNLWGVMHYGTGWSHVMGDQMPINPSARYELDQPAEESKLQRIAAFARDDFRSLDEMANKANLMTSTDERLKALNELIGKINSLNSYHQQHLQ